MVCERMFGSYEHVSFLTYEWEALLVSRYCEVKGGQSPHTIFSTEILVAMLLANGVLL
jgi:hypothetical protein